MFTSEGETEKDDTTLYVLSGVVFGLSSVRELEESDFFVLDLFGIKEIFHGSEYIRKYLCVLSYSDK